MKKYLLLLAILLLIPLVSAESVDEEISKLVSYAEQYEMGNLNYLELQIYSSLQRSKVNSLLGSFQWEENGPEGITSEAAENYFGSPKGYTKYAWDIKSNKEILVEEQVPWFEKSIFDGKRVQIVFHAWPHVYTNGEQTLYYWTDFKIKFKKEYSIDLSSLAAEVKSLGESYMNGGSSAEELGQKISENEQALRSYVEQNSDSCENVLNDLFSSDYKTSEMQKILWKVDFYEGENLNVILKMEMPECDGDCQWPWIGMWLEPNFFKEVDQGITSYERYDRESLKSLTTEELEQELVNTLSELHDIMIQIDNGDASWSKIGNYQEKLNAINEVLSEKYYWGKEENTAEFKIRKEILSNILSEYGGYDSESVEEHSYDLRLISNQEEHKDAWCREVGNSLCDIRTDACISGVCTNALGGSEICDNEVDDDGDTVVDCSDPDCAISCGSYCRFACEGDCWTCHGTCNSQCQECWNCGGDEDCGEICESSGCNSCINACNEQSFCALCSECQQSINQGQPTENLCYSTCDQISSGMTEAETCKNLCNENVLFFCNGVQQSFPCADTTYICDGVTQSIPCTIYTCEIDGLSRKQNVPCGEEYVCGENMQLSDGICVCAAGYYDCDGDGTCSETTACGSETEICNDQADNDNDYLVDCEDLSDCRLQICGDGLICYESSCQEESILEICNENQILSNGLCVDICVLQEDCSDGKVCSFGFCIDQDVCSVDEDCIGYNEFCDGGFCSRREIQSCVINSECFEGYYCKENICFEMQCNSADECLENEICSNYECIENMECASNEDCMYGEQCIDGSCVEISCPEGSYLSNGECISYQSCSVNEDCGPEEVCQSGLCVADEIIERPIETGEFCSVASDCSGVRDICSNGVCKEIPEENYNDLIDEGLIIESPVVRLAPEQLTGENFVYTPKVSDKEIMEAVIEEAPMEDLTGFFLWVTGYAINSCTSNEDCNEGQNCDTFSGNCYCNRGYFDCNGQDWQGNDEDGCETTDPTCGGTRELCQGGCGENQYCDEVTSNCECNEGFYNCDGVWWDCESTEVCAPCTSNEDCSSSKCDKNDQGRVINFGCFQGSTWMEDRGALGFEGKCVTHPTGDTETQLYFYTWGEPFEEINFYRNQQGSNKEWCKIELENALKQRKEIEASLTESFLDDFFERYVQENPEDWEQQIEAIYGMYWGIVDNTRMLAENSKCLDQEFPEINPIEIEYESDIGHIILWEESGFVERFGMDMYTPYMKTWIFPPKEYLKKEFQVAAKEGKLPGPEGEGGPSPEDLNKIRNDPEAMARIKEMTQDYEDGSLDTLITITDETGSLFNIDLSISEADLVQMKIIETYTKDADITIEIDFDFIYELIQATEEVERVEKPEWIEGSFKDSFGQIIGGGKIAAKVAVGVASGDISITPLSKITTGIDIVKMMFEKDI